MLPLPRARVSFQSPIDSTTTTVVRNKTNHQLYGMKMVRPSSHVRFVDWNASKPTPLENSKLCRRVSLPPTTTTSNNKNKSSMNKSNAATRSVIAHNVARRRMVAPATFVINRVTNSVTRAAPRPPPSPFHRIIQEYLPLYVSCRTADEIFDVVTLVLQQTLEQGLLAVVRQGQLVAAPLAAARRCVHRALEAEQQALLARGARMVVAVPVAHHDAPPNDRHSDAVATTRQGQYARDATVAAVAALVDSSESTSSLLSSCLPLAPCVRTSRAADQPQSLPPPQHTRHVSFCSALDLLSAVATANNV